MDFQQEFAKLYKKKLSVYYYSDSDKKKLIRNTLNNIKLDRIILDPIEFNDGFTISIQAGEYL